MTNLLTYFFTVPLFIQRARLFKQLLYLFLLFKCAYWLLNYNLLFGENSVITDKEFDIALIRGAAFYLYDRSHQWLCLWAIAAVIILSVLSLLKIQVYFIGDFITWLIIVNLHYRIYPALTAGDFLLNQLLIFNCCILLSEPNNNSIFSQLKNCFHNFAVIAVMVQVCFLYLASGITKLLDDSWMSGTAISTISQVNHYNFFHAIRWQSNSIISEILNFTVIFYQLLFPLLIWFRKVKKGLLLTGIVIHLYIAFVMGLVTFGLLMLIPYTLFWPQRRNNRLFAEGEKIP